MPFPVIQLSEILFEKGLIEIKQLISLALGTDYTTFFILLSVILIFGLIRHFNCPIPCQLEYQISSHFEAC